MTWFTLSPWRKVGCNCAKNMKLIQMDSESRSNNFLVSYYLEHPTFRLNSSGGDIEAAIGIGRLLRKMSAQVIVPINGTCYSACVFIAAGGVSRSLGDDKIGIHRPYSTRTDDRDFTTVQAEFNRIAALAKAYLQEMNVSPALYDEMVSVPPEEIRILSVSELNGFGLGYEDPVQQEIDDAIGAQAYKLSKTEYLRRKVKAKALCSGLPKPLPAFKCHQEIMRPPTGGRIFKPGEIEFDDSPEP